MKQLLALLISFISLVAAQAQEDLTDSPKIDAESLLRRYRQEQASKPPSDSLNPLNNLMIPGNRKPGVYRLPQDNMPCIVPDSTKTVRIPNSWRGTVKAPYKSKPPRMPNLSTRPEFLSHTTKDSVGRLPR